MTEGIRITHNGMRQSRPSFLELAESKLSRDLCPICNREAFASEIIGSLLCVYHSIRETCKLSLTTGISFQESQTPVMVLRLELIEPPREPKEKEEFDACELHKA